MKIKLWGTRGSSPSTGQNMLRYGGNTTCLEVRTDDGDIIIIDAGTGIRELGKQLKHEGYTGKCTICFTHKHWDHVHGLTSFTPLYTPNCHISLFGPKCQNQTWSQLLEQLFAECHFPLTWDQIGNNHSVKEFNTGESFTVGSALIETCATCHPGGCTAYKITADGWTFFFSGDHEWEKATKAEQEALEAFMDGADVIVADAHFQSMDYPIHKGWGHSTMEQWIEHTLKTKVKRLFFTHHHPDYTDTALESYIGNIRRTSPNVPLELKLAREGMCIAEGSELDPADIVKQISCPMCDFSRKVSRYADPNTILGSVLTEARQLGHADSGTIYLLNDEDKLTFSYAQNETLFPGSAASKMTYLNSTVPKSEKSIAGYVAIMGLPLNIPDVHKLPAYVPYEFNDSFDKSTGYSTVSMLTVPLIDSNNKTVGVLQVINSLQNGKVQPFTQNMQEQLEQLAITAADTIERNRLSHDLIIRMLETSSLRDPMETAEHVMRVGAMASEIYHRWAERHDVPIEELRLTKDTMRLAAMLHDVGKVGIADAILKKPGKLTTEEFEIIKEHCFMGARLFKDSTSRIDVMARNIAQHHHQKWNGEGYTGSDTVPVLSGTDIPLAARITAVADVYDALISTRCYKTPMPVEVALDILQKDAGTSFDPELIEIFLEIKETIDAISARFVE